MLVDFSSSCLLGGGRNGSWSPAAAGERLPKSGLERLFLKGAAMRLPRSRAPTPTWRAPSCMLWQAVVETNSRAASSEVIPRRVPLCLLDARLMGVTSGYLSLFVTYHAQSECGSTNFPVTGNRRADVATSGVAICKWIKTNLPMVWISPAGEGEQARFDQSDGSSRERNSAGNHRASY